MAEDIAVLNLLLTARYVGGPAFRGMASDIDDLVNSTSGLARVGAGMKLIGDGMIAAGVAAASFFGESIKLASDYQDALNRMASVSPDVKNHLQAVSDAIMQTGERFGQDTTKIADGSYFVLSAAQSLGVSVPDILKNNVIPAIGAYVAASGHGREGSVDWNQSAQDLVHVLGGMHIPVNEWANAIGDLTVVENNAGLSQQQLMTGLLRAAPTMSVLGVSFKDTAAAIGALATSGVAGARSGTELAAGLRQMLTNATGLKELKTLGIDVNSLYDAKGNLRDIDDILALVITKTSGLSKQDQFKAYNKLFGAVGGKAFLELTQSSGVYSNLLGAENKKGMTPFAQMLGIGDAQLNDFAGSVAKLKVAFQDFMKLIGGPLITAIKPVLDKLTDSIDRLNGTIRSGKLSGVMNHIPQIAEAATGGLIGGGFLMKGGGSMLFNAATKQMEKHLASKRAIEEWQSKVTSGNAGFYDKYLGVLAKDAEQKKLLAAAPKGPSKTAMDRAKKEFDRARLDFIIENMPRTKTGKISGAGGMGPVAAMLNAYETGGGVGGGGLADYKARRYVANNWNALFARYGGGRTAPVLDDFLAAAGGGRAPKVFKEAPLLFGAMPLPPSEHPTLERQVFGPFGRLFSGVARGQRALFPTAYAEAGNTGRTFLGRMLGIPLGGLHDIGTHTGHGLARLFPSAVKEFRGARAAGDNHFLAGLSGITGGAKDIVTAPFKGIAAVGGKALDFFKFLPTLIPKVIGGLLSFGPAGLVVVAVVLLIVGAITAIVLLFTKFHKQGQQIANFLGSIFGPVWKTILGIIANVVKGIGDAWKKNQPAISKAMDNLVAGIKTMGPIFKFIGGIIVVVLGFIITAIGGVVQGFINALPFIINVFAGIFSFIGNIVHAIVALFHGDFKGAIGFVIAAFKGLWDAVVNLVEGVLTFIGTLVHNILQFFKDLWDKLVGHSIIPDMVKAILDWFHQLFEKGKKKVQDLIDGVKGIFSGLVDIVKGIGHDVVQGFADAITGAKHLVEDAIHGLANLVPDGIKKVLNIKSPSRVTMELGMHTATGFVQGLLGSQSAVTDALNIFQPALSSTNSRSGYNSLSVDTLHVRNMPGLSAPQTSVRDTAEEYLYTRAIQREREVANAAQGNPGRKFDYDYRRAYQYYG